jgi:uncharacterized protein YbjQ (UPF0145 family)
MIVTTTENIPGTRVTQTLGQVFRSIVGGEVGSYVKLLEDARRQAVDRMVANATAMGANAVTMMRFDSSEIGNNMSEIVAYGTAQVVEPVSGAAAG